MDIVHPVDDCFASVLSALYNHILSHIYGVSQTMQIASTGNKNEPGGSGVLWTI